MKTQTACFALLILSLSGNVLAYSSGSTQKSKTSACKAPKLTQFTPPHLSEVAPQTRFSFMASKKTSPKSILVKVKKQAVAVNINETKRGFIISGTLPPELKQTYARVQISAKGTNGCKSKDGWLLKIKN